MHKMFEPKESQIKIVEEKIESSIDPNTGESNTSGKLNFDGFNKKELEQYRVIPENAKNADDTFIPKNGKVYDSDGFYRSDFSDEKYWYKIRDLTLVTVVKVFETGVILKDYFNAYNYLSGWRSKDNPHWTNNPFDK